MLGKACALHTTDDDQSPRTDDAANPEITDNVPALSGFFFALTVA